MPSISTVLLVAVDVMCLSSSVARRSQAQQPLRVAVGDPFLAGGAHRELVQEGVAWVMDPYGGPGTGPGAR
jgi:hypothetical protein